MDDEQGILGALFSRLTNVFRPKPKKDEAKEEYREMLRFEAERARKLAEKRRQEGTPPEPDVLAGMVRNPNFVPKVPVDVDPRVMGASTEPLPAPAAPVAAAPSGRRLTSSTPRDFAPLIGEAVKKHALQDPLFLSALLRQESQFDPNAESHAGAVGLGQFTPITLRELPRIGYTEQFDPRNPEQSIDAAAFYLSNLADRFDSEGPAEERLLRAAAAYNMGPSGFRSVLSKAKNQGLSAPTIDQLIEGGYLPKETSGYIPKIRQYMEDASDF